MRPYPTGYQTSVPAWCHPGGDWELALLVWLLVGCTGLWFAAIEGRRLTIMVAVSQVRHRRQLYCLSIISQPSSVPSLLRRG